MQRKDRLTFKQLVLTDGVQKNAVTERIVGISRHTSVVAGHSGGDRRDVQQLRLLRWLRFRVDLRSGARSVQQ